MNNEEFTKLVESLKAQGMSEEDILSTLLEMFKKGEVTAEDLEKAAGSLGYEVTEEFKKLASGESEEGAPAEGISEEEVEEAQEIPESREEGSEESEEEEESESEESEEESSKEDEKEEARKLYGLGE